MRDDLTDLEQRLVQSAASGEVLDLAPGQDVTSEDVADWDEDRHVRAEVLRELLLGHVTERLDPRGVRARGVVIQGRLDISHASLPVGLGLTESRLDDGLDAEAARIPYLRLDGCVSQSDRQSTTGVVDGVRMRINVMGAHIEDGLTAIGAQLTSQAGSALYAERVTVGSHVLLDGLRATGSGEIATVCLLGAEIDGQLSLNDAELRNRSGPALGVDGATVDGGVFFKGMRASGSGEGGTVRLIGASVTGGGCVLSGVNLENTAGPALHADYLTVTGGGVYIDSWCRAHGSGELGAVRLGGARITGQLVMQQAVLVNLHGPALVADHATITGGVFLNGLRALGTGDDGTLRLAGMHIRGQLMLRDATLTNVDANGPALHAQEAVIRGHVFLDGAFAVDGDPALDLSLATVGSALDLSPASIKAASMAGRWNVDGLTYVGLPSVGGSAWLDLLRHGTADYASQPYQQLATACRNAGHEAAARRVLIEQRRDQIERGDLNPVQKLWARFTGITVGYGYRPWLAMVWLLGVLGLSFLLVFGSAAADPTLLGPVPEGSRSPTGTLLYSGTGTCDTLGKSTAALDIGLPLVGLTLGPACQVNANADNSTRFLVLSWVLRLAAWGFAALFVAGFTSAIRKP